MSCGKLADSKANGWSTWREPQGHICTEKGSIMLAAICLGTFPMMTGHRFLRWQSNADHQRRRSRPADE